MFSTLQGFTAEIRKFARAFRKLSPRIPHSLPKEIRENKFCKKKNTFTVCKFLFIYRVIQRKVWFAAPDAKLYLFCAPFNVFSIFFENLYFFWYSNGPKENLRTFFLSKSKVQKSKNVHSYYFSLSLKFY